MAEPVWCKSALIITPLASITTPPGFVRDGGIASRAGGSPPFLQDLVDSIQKTRKTHDRVYDRWPPHINFLYPFIKEENFSSDADAQKRLKKATDKCAPFTIHLAEFRAFKQGRSSTVYLAAEATPTTGGEDPIQVLHAAMLKEFPQCRKAFERHGGTFTPHLTVAQFKKHAQAIAFCNQMNLTWSSVDDAQKRHSFLVDKVDFISRHENGIDPFVFQAEFPLMGVPGPAPDAVTPALAPVVQSPQLDRPQLRPATSVPKATVPTEVPVMRYDKDLKCWVNVKSGSRVDGKGCAVTGGGRDGGDTVVEVRPAV